MAGLVHEMLWANGENGRTPGVWWRQRFEQWEGQVLMLLTVESIAFLGDDEPVWHQVGALMDFDEGTVQISCSSLHKVWTGTVNEFIASPYGSCIEVMAVFPAILDLYEFEDSVEYGPHLKAYRDAGWQGDKGRPPRSWQAGLLRRFQTVCGLLVKRVKKRDTTHLDLTEEQWAAEADLTERDTTRMRASWQADAPAEAVPVMEATDSEAQ